MAYIVDLQLQHARGDTLRFITTMLFIIIIIRSTLRPRQTYLLQYYNIVYILLRAK